MGTSDMLQQWTFSRRISASLAVGTVLTVLIGVISIVALRSVILSSDRVMDVHVQQLLDAKELDSFLERKVSASRGFLISADDDFMGRVEANDGRFSAVLEKMKKTASTSEELRLLDAIGTAAVAH